MSPSFGLPFIERLLGDPRVVSVWLFLAGDPRNRYLQSVQVLSDLLSVSRVLDKNVELLSEHTDRAFEVWVYVVLPTPGSIDASICQYRVDRRQRQAD